MLIKEVDIFGGKFEERFRVVIASGNEQFFASPLVGKQIIRPAGGRQS
jgi:hypothetical protein